MAVADVEVMVEEEDVSLLHPPFVHRSSHRICLTLRFR